MWTKPYSKMCSLVLITCFGLALAQEAAHRSPQDGDGVETMLVGDTGSTLLVGRFAGTMALGKQRLRAAGAHDLYYMVYDAAGLLAAGRLGGTGADRFFGAHLNAFGEFVVRYAEEEHGALTAARLVLNASGQVVEHTRAPLAARITLRGTPDGVLQRRLSLTPTYRYDMPYTVLDPDPEPEDDDPAGFTVLDPDPEPEVNDPVGLFSPVAAAEARPAPVRTTVLDPDPEPETNDPVGKTELDPDPEPEVNDPVGFTVLDPDPEPETNDPVGKTVLDPDPEPEVNDPVGFTVLDPDPEPETNDPVGIP